MEDGDSDSFIINVTAQTEQAAQGFNSVIQMIQSTVTQGSQQLAFLDRALGRVGSSALAVAARFTAWGAAVTAAVAAFDTIVAKGGQFVADSQFAEPFGRFVQAVRDLKDAVGATFAERMDQSRDAMLGFAMAVSGVDEERALTAVERVVDLHVRIARTAQIAVERYREVENQSDRALAGNIENAEVRLRRLRERLDQEPGWFARWLFGSEEEVREQIELRIAGIEEELEGYRSERLRRQAAARAAVTADWLHSPEIEQSIEALRRQNDQLQISIATFGLAAGAAARLRIEMQLMRAGVGDGASERQSNEWQAAADEVERLTGALDALNAAKRQQDEAERRERQIDRILTRDEGGTAQILARAAAIGQTAGETARLVELERLLAAIRTAGRQPTEDEIVMVRALAAERGHAAQRLADAQRQMQNFQDLAGAMSRSLERAFSDWTSKAELDWKKFFNTLMRDIAMITLRHNILQPLFGGGGIQGGGWFGQALQSLTGFGGARAEGGPVVPGLGYLIGERGPELFMPDVPGTVMPNGAGGATTINMRIDLAGANGDETIARISGQAARAAAVAAVQQSNEAFPARQRNLHMLGT